MENLNENENINKGPIMIGLCIAVLIACLDSTVVATCGPIIVRDLGGEDVYSWILTAYLLCSTIMIPIAGKLSDLYGRKLFLFIGLVLFAAGSLLAGMCQEMGQFIACRCIQGLGGGILIPVSTAAVGDLYDITDRAKMQGILGAAYGIGSGAGPLLGGFLTEYFSWHWAFYINIPLVIVCALLITRGYPRVKAPDNVSIDVRGITVLSLLLIDVLLLMEWGGREFEWSGMESILMIVAAVVLVALFVFIERRALEPVLSPRLIRNGVVVKSALFMFIMGLTMMGANTYIAFFGINVLGFSAMETGWYAMAMVVGMIITTTVSGATVYRIGYRPWLIAGPVLGAAGLYLMSLIEADSGTGIIVVSLFLFGLGVGCFLSIIMTAVQNSAEDNEIGMTTSAVNLLRNVGSTMGTAVFTMIINNGIASRMNDLVPGTIPQIIADLLPKDTSIVVAARIPDLAMISDDLIWTFVDSVGTAFNFAAVILVLLVPVGLVYRAKRPSR